MKISSKGRYALAVLTSMAKHEGIGKLVSVVNLSERLGISKIYLEQVFSLLKRGGLVVSVKGASGGYYLKKPPNEITTYEVLSATESALFEKPEAIISKQDENLERSINETVFIPLDDAIHNALSGISIDDIMNKSGEDHMYHI